MSNNGYFEVEDGDIVKLESSNEHNARSGWVNVGTHAVWLQLDEAGNLEVEVSARTNEGGSLGTVKVTKVVSVAHGGVDPDSEN